MAEAPDKDQKTEAPTEKRRREAADKGDVLQSKELATALVIVAGAAWLLVSGPMLVGALRDMLADGLSFGRGDLLLFDPLSAFVRLAAGVLVPLVVLFALSLLAAIAAPALLGSLGFRAKAFAFKPNKLNPGAGLKRIFGKQGLTELLKSLAKVVLLGAIGWWLLQGQADLLLRMGTRELEPALAAIGDDFSSAILVMALGLAAIALIDVPAQFSQRGARLRMSKQEVKDESKESEGSPELKGAIRRRQHEVLRGAARSAVQEATVVLTNPTHFAVALRYDPDKDGAPVVVARGRGATAAAIRELAGESKVPVLNYPQLTRALYYTTKTGAVVREDLYLAVATVLAFVFNLEAALAAGASQPPVEVPTGARFDEQGRPQD